MTRARIAAQRAFNEPLKQPTAVDGWLNDGDGSTIWASPYDLTPDDDFLD